MEIHLNTNVNEVGLRQANGASRPAQTPSVSTEFTNSANLNQDLQNTPDVRPEAVEKAKHLIGDVEYPPPETIHRISVLLAMHLDSESK